MKNSETNRRILNLISLYKNGNISRESLSVGLESTIDYVDDTQIVHLIEEANLDHEYAVTDPTYQGQFDQIVEKILLQIS